MVALNKTNININLPNAFRHHYNKVAGIIDCFKIEIQKSSKLSFDMVKVQKDTL